MRHNDVKMIVKYADFISQCETAMEQIEDFNEFPNNAIIWLPEQLQPNGKGRL